MKADQITAGESYAVSVYGTLARGTAVRRVHVRGTYRWEVQVEGRERPVHLGSRAFLGQWDRYQAGEREPLADSPERPAGTCAICQAVFVVRRGRLVLHGYQRPGDGFLRGDCFGAGRPPFELAPDALVEFRPHLSAYLTGRAARLAQLRAGEVHEIAVPVRARGGSREPGSHFIVRRGDAPNYMPSRGPTHAGFEALLRAAIADAERDVRWATEDLERIDRMIAEWEPRPLRTK